MACACVKNSCSLWERLVPDLQKHIYGLAVEQHCRELMRTQVCPDIILAAIKRNQASFEPVDWQFCRLMRYMWGCREGDQCRRRALEEVMTKHSGFQDDFCDAVDAFMSSIAGLPRHMRCLWMRHLRDAVGQERLSIAFRRRTHAQVCFGLPLVPVRGLVGTEYAAGAGGGHSGGGGDTILTVSVGGGLSGTGATRWRSLMSGQVSSVKCP